MSLVFGLQKVVGLQKKASFGGIDPAKLKASAVGASK